MAFICGLDHATGTIKDESVNRASASKACERALSIRSLLKALYIHAAVKEAAIITVLGKIFRQKKSFGCSFRSSEQNLSRLLSASQKMGALVSRLN
jgi:hypothetical protein